MFFVITDAVPSDGTPLLAGESPIPELELNDLVNRLVATDDPEEVRHLYKIWAETYDHDLDDFGYVAPAVGVSIFKQLNIPDDARIHDAGCGTGQVGSLLASAGFGNLHGSDFSDDMLAVAGGRGCYQSLVQADYTKPLEFSSNSVDGIISIGVYTKRFKNNFLKEMLRMLNPGGWMVFSCRPLYFDEVADSLKSLHKAGAILKSSIVYDDYMLGQGASAYYISLCKSSV